MHISLTDTICKSHWPFSLFALLHNEGLARRLVVGSLSLLRLSVRACACYGQRETLMARDRKTFGALAGTRKKRKKERETCLTHTQFIE